MASIQYLDIDLKFDALPGSAQRAYRVSVVESPVGEAEATFTLPFSDLELENLMLRISRTRRGVRRVNSPEMQAVREFGSKLFKAVFADQVLGCLLRSLDEAAQHGHGLRIRLRLEGAPDLIDLPWEYLHNPSLDRFLSLSAETPIVRYLSMPERIEPIDVRPPLNILVMIAAPRGFESVAVDEEWNKLKAALKNPEMKGLITITRVPAGTLPALRRQLRLGTYHVLHFVGHGGFDTYSEEGALLLEDDDGRAIPISGNKLGTLLHDHHSLRLVLLNACEGARTSRHDPFAGVAQSLVQQGIPSVIAMQFEVTDKAALILAQEFYGALADGFSVDAALAEARKSVFAEGNDIEWGTPVLFSRTAHGQVFRLPTIGETGLASPRGNGKRHSFFLRRWLVAVAALFVVLGGLALVSDRSTGIASWPLWRTLIADENSMGRYGAQLTINNAPHAIMHGSPVKIAAKSGDVVRIEISMFKDGREVPPGVTTYNWTFHPQDQGDLMRVGNRTDTIFYPIPEDGRTGQAIIVNTQIDGFHEIIEILISILP